jgi:DNA-binding NtrC family response regulator
MIIFTKKQYLDHSNGNISTPTVPAYDVGARDLDGSMSPIPANKEVLIVDDDEISLCLLRRFVNMAGFHAVYCSSGKDAIELARHANAGFCLAIIDYHMPGMDGILTYNGLRSEHPGLKAILYTDNPDIAGLSEMCPPGLFCKKKDFDFPALGALMKQLLWTVEPSVAFE